MQLKTDICFQFLRLICSGCEKKKKQKTEKRKSLLPVLTLNQFWLLSSFWSLWTIKKLCQRKRERITFPPSRPTRFRIEQQWATMQSNEQTDLVSFTNPLASFKLTGLVVNSEQTNKVTNELTSCFEQTGEVSNEKLWADLRGEQWAALSWASMSSC